MKYTAVSCANTDLLIESNLPGVGSGFDLVTVDIPDTMNLPTLNPDMIQNEFKLLTHANADRVCSQGDALIMILNSVKNRCENSKWVFVNYTAHNIARWDGDYQHQIWLNDKELFGVRDDLSLAGKSVKNKPKPAPTSLRVCDALSDRILNNGIHIPDNPLLEDIKKHALELKSHSNLTKWEEVMPQPSHTANLHSKGTRRNYAKLIAEINVKNTGLTN